MTVKQITERAHVSYGTVHRWIAWGWIAPLEQRGEHHQRARTYHFRTSDVDRVLEDIRAGRLQRRRGRLPKQSA